MLEADEVLGMTLEPIRFSLDWQTLQVAYFFIPIILFLYLGGYSPFPHLAVHLQQPGEPLPNLNKVSSHQGDKFLFPLPISEGE